MNGNLMKFNQANLCKQKQVRKDFMAIQKMNVASKKIIRSPCECLQ